MVDGVRHFKERYEKFKEALTYINKNINMLKKDQTRWEKISYNFKAKFEQPLDDAWASLPKEEKEKFATLYLRRRETADQEMARIQKVADMFKGRIIKYPRRIKWHGKAKENVKKESTNGQKKQNEKNESSNGDTCK